MSQLAHLGRCFSPGYEFMSDWHLLSTYALVLLAIGNDNTATLRQIGDAVGITERSTHRIVAELVDGGYLHVTKNGRRNVYRIEEEARLRHPLTRDIEVGALLDLLNA